MNEKKFLLFIFIISIPIILSTGCIDNMPPMSEGTPVPDDNATHQEWMRQYKENPEKYLYNPENPLEWTLKGLACAASGGEHEKALEYFDTAIELDPEFAEPYYAKGVSLLNMERYDEAEEYFQKAIALNPYYKPLTEDFMHYFTSKRSND